MVLTDQLNRVITIDNPIKSVISLVPSHTELLFDLGLKDLIKGRTKFCIHPSSEIHNVPIVGGTKNINHSIIRSINPDLIIANKEENRKEDVLNLAKEYPIWVSEIKTLQDSIEMIQQMGTLFNKQDQANSIQNETYLKTDTLSFKPSKKAAYLIWQDPFMTVGADTYIHNMMNHLGFENVFASFTRYPEVSADQILKANPDIILLSSEPFPFSEKHKDHYKTIFEGVEIEIVDGEVFSWFGSRIIHKNKF